MHVDKLQGLSTREHQIVLRVLDGLANKTIASYLFISERTVKFHCADIYRKLNVRNRQMLISWYFKDKYEPETLAAEPQSHMAHYSHFDK